MYKQRTPLGQRVLESNKIRERFPGRIPIIVEKAQKIASNIPNIDKNKFLVPGDLSFGQFLYVVRRRLQLDPDKALFMFVSNILVASSELMQEVYNKYKDTDGFLYVVYSGESTFGGLMKYTN
jgi:GABA(A) receptor-associated protein